MLEKTLRSVIEQLEVEVKMLRLVLSVAAYFKHTKFFYDIVLNADVKA